MVLTTPHRISHRLLEQNLTSIPLWDPALDLVARNLAHTGKKGPTRRVPVMMYSLSTGVECLQSICGLHELLKYTLGESSAAFGVRYALSVVSCQRHQQFFKSNVTLQHQKRDDRY